MKVARHGAWALAGLLFVGGVASQVHSQQAGPPHGPGHGQGFQGGRGQGFQSGRGHGFRGGRGSDAQFAVDRDDFHFLLENHEKIHRQVTNTKDGVETLTESDTPAVAERLRKHVRAMYERVENKQAIRMHDPLYVEIFRNADKIEMKVENTKQGIRVVETSSDPYVVSLIQEHAKVVSGFAKRGFDEAHKNHPVPGKTLSADEQFVGCKAGGKKACCAGKTCPSESQNAKEVSSKGQSKDGQCSNRR